jgi:hypothetical protein
MPFTWVAVDDEPSKASKRAYIERNCIAFLSNACHPNDPIDPPSAMWLGNHCPHPDVRRSGLWNCRHVDEEYDPGFLDDFELQVAKGG